MMFDAVAWADRVKDIAPFLGIASALLALLQDQFRVLPKRLAPYFFCYSALSVDGFWVFTRVSNPTIWSYRSQLFQTVIADFTKDLERQF
jgi:hypothetical protein